MPYATNQGVRIYYEVEGAGPPLVLHHGSFGSSADWTELGYADDLKRDHQLVLLDARGHGKSDKPYDPAAYDLRLRALDVVGGACACLWSLHESSHARASPRQ